MEAKGFGAPGGRSWARESRLRSPDLVVVLLAVMVATAAISGATAAGTWALLERNG